MGRVEGKVAFITGAGQGQGRAHALRLAEEGADIIATDLCADLPAINYKQASVDDLKETQRLVEGTGRRCVTATADVRTRADMDAAVAAGIAAFGHIDVVVANAGVITFHSSSLDIPEETYDLIVDVNQKGVWNTIQATAPGMVEARRGGSIIITSSAAGLRGQVPYAHYVASKHAVVGLARAFANELGRYGIRVNTIHPTGVASEGMGADPSAATLFEREPLFIMGAQNILPDLDTPPETWSAATPIPAMAVEEIANAVLWLASDESRYVTGSALPIDAGSTQKP